MRLKQNIEEGIVLLFIVEVFGYNSKVVLSDLLNKMWLSNRWMNRFYFSVSERCHKFVINVSTLNRKEDMNKVEFVKQFKARIPKDKKIVIS
jgi:hypothetical protein